MEELVIELMYELQELKEQHEVETRELKKQIAELSKQVEKLSTLSSVADDKVTTTKEEKSENKKLDIYRFLREVGFPPQVLGYKYITDILILSLRGEIEFPGCNITKVVYPEIARIHKTTPSGVDRAIRQAIDITWKKGGNLDKKIEVFGNASYEGKPTNAYFLASTIEYIKHEM